MKNYNTDLLGIGLFGLLCISLLLNPVKSDSCNQASFTFGITIPCEIEETEEAKPICWVEVDSVIIAEVLHKSNTYTLTLDDIIPSKPKAKYTQLEVKRFLASNKLLERAYEGSIKSKIPVSVLVAQVILESDLGNSSLTKATGNLGNIKCRCNRRSKLRSRHQKLHDQGNPVCVSGYDKIEKGTDWYKITKSNWKDWSDRIRLLSGYAVISNNKNTTYGWYDWCDLLHRSPYASDKLYDVKLRNLIRAYNLNKFDKLYNVNISSDNGEFIYWKGLS